MQACLSLAFISWGCSGIVNTWSFCVALSDRRPGWNCTLPAFLDGWQRAALGRVQLEEMTLSPARSQSGGARCQPQQYSVENGRGATQSSAGSAWFWAEGVVQLAALISTCHGLQRVRTVPPNTLTDLVRWCHLPTSLRGCNDQHKKTSCYETNGDSSKGQRCVMLKHHKKKVAYDQMIFFIFQRYRCTNKTFFYKYYEYSLQYLKKKETCYNMCKKCCSRVFVIVYKSVLLSHHRNKNRSVSCFHTSLLL